MDARPHADPPLPDILGAAPPDHDLRGRILVLVIHGLAVTLFAAALAGIAGDSFSPGEAVSGVTMAAMGCGVLAYVGEGLRRFKCWAWFFVMFSLLMPALLLLAGLVLGPASAAESASTVAGAMMVLGAMHYLWQRRWEFWIDARLERIRPAPRAVTAQWRAARLTRIGAAPPRAPTSRAGALWMRRAPGVRA